MPYSVKQYEWAIPEDEQEAARFIIQFAHDSNERLSIGGLSESSLTLVAYEAFTAAWYQRLRIRLGIVAYPSIDLKKNAFALGAISISLDGTKLLGQRIERVE